MAKDSFPFDFFESGAIISRHWDQLLLGWGKRTWLEKNDPKSPFPYFYSPGFFLENSTPWFVHEHTKEITLSDFLTQIEPYVMDNEGPLTWESPYQEFYKENFEELKERFRTTALQKAVPFVAEICQRPMTRSLFYHSLVNAIKYKQTYPSYLYGFWDHESGLLGATPEFLYKLDLNEKPFMLKTIAFGGTHLKPYVHPKIMEEDPNWQKLLHEHGLIVQGILQELSTKGTAKAGNLRLVRLPTFTHLATDIEVDLEDPMFIEEFICSLHPTPALGGYPKRESLEWLHDYQAKIDRALFGAPFGYTWHAAKESRCYIAIRNMQWRNNQIRICAGGGVVQDSQLDMEWKEIQKKINSIKSIFQI